MFYFASHLAYLANLANIGTIIIVILAFIAMVFFIRRFRYKLIFSSPNSLGYSDGCFLIDYRRISFTRLFDIDPSFTSVFYLNTKADEKNLSKVNLPFSLKLGSFASQEIGNYS